MKGLHRVKRKVKDQVKVTKKPQFPVVVPPIKDPTFNYSSTFDTRRPSRASFNPSEYNLAEVGRISDVDSYVARSFEKKLALMFKEHWNFTGKNPRTLEYIRARFAQIATATSLPTSELFRRIGDGLVRKSNAFVVKVRNVKSSGGRVRTVFGTRKQLKPVAGYFVPPAETFEFSMTGNHVAGWQQSMPYGQTKFFSKDNVSHFAYNKKDGFIFGTPTLVPVIDDVRALRKIEENIELLIYQHLFPLFQWTVGTKEAPATTAENGEKEVDIVRREIQYLPTEGGIVTTERHEIKAIGAEGRAIRAEGYLTHFKRRVFSGLDMSPIDFGESDSSNRSTSEQLSQNLIDRIKDFQRVMEGFVNELLIKELLLESNFNFNVLDEENVVRFKFREIDIDLQIRKDNHYADLFEKNVIGLNEARFGMDRDAILLPTPDEIDNGQDGPEKFPGWYELRWPLMDRPKALIAAVDEAYTSVSKTAQAAKQTQQEELAVKKQQIANKKAVKNMVVRDAFLTQRYKDTKKQIVDYLKETEETDFDFISQLIRASLTPAVEKVNQEQVSFFRKGYSDFLSARGPIYIEAVALARNRFRDRAEFYINKLIRDIISSLNRNLRLNDEITLTVEAVFDSFAFRSKFIEDVEVRKARNYGRVVAMKLAGIKSFIIEGNEESCDMCKDHIGQVLKTDIVTLGDISPFHANCDCQTKSYFENVELTDSVEEVVDCDNNIIEDKQNRSAQKAARKTRMSNCIQRMISILRRDNPSLESRDLKAFAEAVCYGRLNDEEIQDISKMERCVLKVKKSLRKQHPSWESDKIKSSAYAICNSRLKE
jgi:hypothetical protein